jgi:ATP-binding protein involved in chromosome partitioning
MKQSLSGTQVDTAEIERGFAKIIDPELGRPITDMKLIDKLSAEGGSVTVEFHLTAPFCPPVFALKIASDIKAAVLAAKGVSAATVTLRGHYLAEAVNKQVNKTSQPQA